MKVIETQIEGNLIFFFRAISHEANFNASLTTTQRLGFFFLLFTSEQFFLALGIYCTLNF